MLRDSGRLAPRRCPTCSEKPADLVRNTHNCLEKLEERTVAYRLYPNLLNSSVEFPYLFFKLSSIYFSILTPTITKDRHGLQRITASFHFYLKSFRYFLSSLNISSTICLVSSIVNIVLVNGSSRIAWNILVLSFSTIPLTANS